MGLFVILSCVHLVKSELHAAGHAGVWKYLKDVQCFIGCSAHMHCPIDISTRPCLLQVVMEDIVQDCCGSSCSGEPLPNDAERWGSTCSSCMGCTCTTATAHSTHPPTNTHTLHMHTTLSNPHSASSVLSAGCHGGHCARLLRQRLFRRAPTQ